MTMTKFWPLQQLDLLVLAEDLSQQNRLNPAMHAETVNLLKLLIGKCVARVAAAKEKSDEQDHG